MSVKGVIGFILGAVLGGIGVWKLQEYRWEKKLDDAKDEVKESYIRGEDIFEDEACEIEKDNKPNEVIDESTLDLMEKYRNRNNDPIIDISHAVNENGVSVAEFEAYKKLKAEHRSMQEEYGIYRPYVDHPYYISEEEYHEMCDSSFDYTGHELYFDSESGDVYFVDGTLWGDNSDGWHHLGKAMLDITLEDSPDPLYIQNDDMEEVYMLFKSEASSGMNEGRRSAGLDEKGRVWHRYEFDELDPEDEIEGYY